MQYRTRLLLLGMLCLTLASACTSKSEGEPGPAESTRSTTQSSEQPTTSDTDTEEDLPTDGAPAVSDPLDTATFQQDPCQSLTAAQSQELNVGTTGKRYDDTLGNGCQWMNTQTLGETIIGFLDKDPRGLSAVYKADKAGEWAYFEELPAIDGYPAVARSQTDDRGDGYCSVVIGASDEVAFDVYLHLSRNNVGKKDPCEVAAQVGGMALQTMQHGG